MSGLHAVCGCVMCVETWNVVGKDSLAEESEIHGNDADAVYCILGRGKHSLALQAGTGGAGHRQGEHRFWGLHQ